MEVVSVMPAIRHWMILRYADCRASWQVWSRKCRGRPSGEIQGEGRALHGLRAPADGPDGIHHPAPAPENVVRECDEPGIGRRARGGLPQGHGDRILLRSGASAQAPM